MEKTNGSLGRAEVKRTPDGGVVIALPPRAARVLMSILGKVGGEPQKGPREDANQIWEGLKQAGFQYNFGLFPNGGIIGANEWPESERAMWPTDGHEEA